ncbi:MAG: glutathione synthase [Stagnimonas sp.]|nr:glutathione synthase [Stagnimonas sp.]
MTYTLGVVMDPIAGIKPYKDTTLALMLAAQARGFALRYFELPDLWLRDGVAWGRARPVKVFDDKQHWFELGAAEDLELGRLDAILMRKDPPFDLEYVTASYILERAEAAGALVVNKPASLRDCNEKVFISWFAGLCAPTLISRDPARLKAFHAEQGDVIYKPLDGMGGAGIFRVREDALNLGSVIESLSQNGRQTIMAQRYLPAIVEGDTRVLMVDGEPVPYGLARVPQGTETRGNLAAGGKGEPRPLTTAQRRIAAVVGPELKRRGLLFVGLDVIGDCLTEINVTSPTCAREIDAAYGTDIGGLLMTAIETRLKNRPAA